MEKQVTRPVDDMTSHVLSQERHSFGLAMRDVFGSTPESVRLTSQTTLPRYADLNDQRRFEGWLLARGGLKEMLRRGAIALSADSVIVEAGMPRNGLDLLAIARDYARLLVAKRDEVAILGDSRSANAIGSRLAVINDVIAAAERR